MSRTAGRVLVANRGEIAVRIIRACRDLGWESIGVYADGDENALHVQMSSEAYRLESALPIPYLDGAALVRIGDRAKATYVHPGYGFLAENAQFALECLDAGLIFVGPSAEAIATMGDKVAARAAAIRAGLPILPGTLDPLADATAARSWAAGAGFPVALKAAAGGGGRGFRVAKRAEDLDGAFASAQSEAERAFGDGRLYAERYLVRPRHVEVQIFADNHGATVAIGDRDCSIQRRHQKLLEESPAPNLPVEIRQEMAEASIRLAAEVNYSGAGTLEYLVEPDGKFWFLEMNTRIQVEHTVTEEVFGVDLVREQLLVASGERLSFDQDLPQRGHSIQCRINAEDPGRGFAPNPGIITKYVAPQGPGIRVDSAVESGSAISERYDSMVAKVIASGADRAMAISRMIRGLDELVIEGIPTTADLHRAILQSDAFRRAEVSTSFLPDHPDNIPEPWAGQTAVLETREPWRDQVVEVNGRRFSVRIPENDRATSQPATARPKRAKPTRQPHVSSGRPALASPYQGSVLRILKTAGETVTAGETILVIEAMKMENEISAHRTGTLVSVGPAISESIKVGDLLFTIE